MCKRGDIYWAQIPVTENSNIQNGRRPVLVVSNNKANQFSPTIHVIPLTTEIKKQNLPVHVMLYSGDLKEETMALVEQMSLIDKHRLRGKIGTISDIDMKNIARAIRVQVDLFEEEDSYAKQSIKLLKTS